MSRIDTTPNSCWTFHDYTQRNTLGRKPFIGREWNELPETIIEAANTEAFKLALRPRPVPIENLNIFYFYITSTNSLHCFLAHIARAQHISAEDGLYCPLQIRHLDLDWANFWRQFENPRSGQLSKEKS